MWSCIKSPSPSPTKPNKSNIKRMDSLSTLSLRTEEFTSTKSMNNIKKNFLLIPVLISPTTRNPSFTVFWALLRKSNPIPFKILKPSSTTRRQKLSFSVWTTKYTSSVQKHMNHWDALILIRSVVSTCINPYQPCLLAQHAATSSAFLGPINPSTLWANCQSIIAIILLSKRSKSPVIISILFPSLISPFSDTSWCTSKIWKKLINLNYKNSFIKPQWLLWISSSGRGYACTPSITPTSNKKKLKNAKKKPWTSTSCYPRKDKDKRKICSINSKWDKNKSSINISAFFNHSRNKLCRIRPDFNILKSSLDFLIRLTEGEFKRKVWPMKKYSANYTWKEINSEIWGIN